MLLVINEKLFRMFDRILRGKTSTLEDWLRLGWYSYVYILSGIKWTRH